ncbi:MAG: PEGA domain-containing protein [Myxococcales bacterium]|nr:PEGA domain-containing protein [Myxococcales bacterium]
MTPAAGTQPGPARLAWVTRERLLMASVLVAVIILAAVVTSFLVDDAPPPAVAEDARGEVITITGAAAPVTEPPAVAANANGATLLVRSTPAGANIKVDGSWLPERTPARAIVPAGRAVELIVRLDNHDEYRTQVTVSPGETRTLNATLQERTGTITVESEPSQAEVSVDGVVVGRTPLTHPNVSMRRAVRVMVEKDGYEPHRATVDWGSGPEQVVKVELQAMPVAPPVAVNLPEARPAPVARVAPRPTRRVTRPEPRPTRRVREPREPREPRRPRVASRDRGSDRGAEAPARGGGGGGKLSVQSRRWGSVLINGRLVATETPLLNKPLPEGTYRVQVCFEGNRDDCSTTRRVTVYADQTAKVVF